MNGNKIGFLDLPTTFHHPSQLYLAMPSSLSSSSSPLPSHESDERLTLVPLRRPCSSSVAFISTTFPRSCYAPSRRVHIVAVRGRKGVGVRQMRPKLLARGGSFAR